ncbi:hypothetical protein DFH06DRAFT_1340279 [Mycena polygramma]|nr:hypothetical protein DFH06DRAFT_1340279 [Mycena polygramma]
MERLNGDIIDEILDVLLLPQDHFFSHYHYKTAATKVCVDWKNRIYSRSTYWRTVWYHRFMYPEYVAFCISRTGSHPRYALVIIATPYPCVPSARFQFVPVRSRPFIVQVHALRNLLKDTFHGVSRLTVRARWNWQVHAIMRVVAHLQSDNLHRIEAHAHADNVSLPLDAHNTVGWTKIATMNFDRVHPLWAGFKLFPNLHELGLGALDRSFAVTTDQIIGMLREASQLEVLKVESVDISPSVASSKVVMQHLRHFNMIYDADHNVAFLKHVDMPAVRHLKLEAHDRASVDFLLRVCPSCVEHAGDVTLSADRIYPGEIGSWIADLGSVVQLNLGLCEEIAGTEVVLAMEHDQRAMPALRHITVQGDLSDAEAEDIFAILERGQEIVVVTVGAVNKTKDTRRVTEWRRVAGQVTRGQATDEAEPHTVFTNYPTRWLGGYSRTSIQ